MRLATRSTRAKTAGFTLAEVAVTLLIVAIGLTLVLQGPSSAKMSAADTHYRKLARDLALLTLGRLESGLYWEELDGGDGSLLTGTYAEEGHEEVHYELVLGDQEFSRDQDRYDQRQDTYYDSWEGERERQDRLKQKQDKKDDEDEQATEPFEKARIKVTYPQFGERENALILERWVPWEQVYGSEGDEQADATEGGEDGGSK